MIGLLQGTLFYKNETNIIIMVNGVGYRVESIASLLAIHEGESILAYIYTHVREDAIKLYGFSNEEELRIFEMLLTVSGIGPKGAMAIVSKLGVKEVLEAIIREDAKVFKAISGIGTKNAEKIIIELKTKIKKEERENIESTSSYTTLQEFEQALLALGYSLAEIKNIEGNVVYSENLPSMIKEGLRLLNR